MHAVRTVWADFERDVEARSGHGVPNVREGRATQPSRVKFCHAGAKRTFPRETDQDGRTGLIGTSLWGTDNTDLFVSQSLNGIKARCLVRRPQPKDNADG